jgi:hypothetical protein
MQHIFNLNNNEYIKDKISYKNNKIDQLVQVDE